MNLPTRSRRMLPQTYLKFKITVIQRISLFQYKVQRVTRRFLYSFTDYIRGSDIRGYFWRLFIFSSLSLRLLILFIPQPLKNLNIGWQHFYVAINFPRPRILKLANLDQKSQSIQICQPWSLQINHYIFLNMIDQLQNQFLSYLNLSAIQPSVIIQQRLDLQHYFQQFEPSSSNLRNYQPQQKEQQTPPFGDIPSEMFDKTLLPTKRSIELDNQDNDFGSVIEQDMHPHPEVVNTDAQTIPQNEPSDYLKNLPNHITKTCLKAMLSQTHKRRLSKLCKKHGVSLHRIKEQLKSWKLIKTIGLGMLGNILKDHSRINTVFQLFFTWYMRRRYLIALLAKGKMQYKDKYIKIKNDLLFLTPSNSTSA